MEKIEIFEQPLFNMDEKDFSNEIGRIAIIRGGVGASNPKAILDKVVSEYVDHEAYNQFVEIHLDNPWIRVVIKGMDKLQYEPFNKQHI